MQVGVVGARYLARREHAVFKNPYLPTLQNILSTTFYSEQAAMCGHLLR